MRAPLLFLAALTAQPSPAPTPEQLVAAALEDARKAEQFLDAQALRELIAASFTSVEEGARLAGAFAFLEPLRRARARGLVVQQLTFDNVVIQVYGASAIASYTYLKAWRDGGRRQQARGWSSDVYERREDGAWILVHRHRSPAPVTGGGR